MLREVAARVRAGLRESDLVARLGGDEFVVALEDLRSPRDAQTVADQLRLAIARPIDVGGDAVRCTASVGIAFGSGGRGQPGALLAAADAAMFERKRSQRPARAAAAEGDRQA